MGPAEVAYGPYLIGLLLNVMLYGITITQTYLYYTSAKRDRWQIQAFVYFLFVADTVQSIFSCISVYQGVITHFGDDEYLNTGDWKFATEPALTGIIGGLVQMFFVRRLKVLTRNNYLVLIVLSCAITSILMGIATGAAIHFVPQFTEFQRFRVVVIIWLVCAACGDLLITTSLVVYLRRMKSGLPRSDSQVDKIIRLSIQTGLLTSIWAVVDLFVYLFNPTGLHLIFNTPLSKLYTNSLMSSLNARDFWKIEEDDTIQTTGLFNGLRFRSFAAKRISLNRAEASVQAGMFTSNCTSTFDSMCKKDDPPRHAFGLTSQDSSFPLPAPAKLRTAADEPVMDGEDHDRGAV